MGFKEEARKDFYNDGGRISNHRMAGRIWLTCIACKHHEVVHKNVLDRAARPRCPACGWDMEASKASVKKNTKAHAAQAERGDESGIIENGRQKAKTGKRRTPSGKRGR